MPESCFSYPTGPCFSYSTGAPRGAGVQPVTPGGGGGVMGPCFSYPPDVPWAALRRMPVGPCFSYTGARITYPSFTTTACFRY